MRTFFSYAAESCRWGLYSTSARGTAASATCNGSLSDSSSSVTAADAGCRTCPRSVMPLLLIRMTTPKATHRPSSAISFLQFLFTGFPLF